MDTLVGVIRITHFTLADGEYRLYANNDIFSGYATMKYTWFNSMFCESTKHYPLVATYNGDSDSFHVRCGNYSVPMGFLTWVED